MASLETVIDSEAARFPYGATLVCVTSQMDEPLAGSLQRIARAGHTVTVVSLAEQEDEFSEQLPGIRVYNIAKAMRSLEVRDGMFSSDTEAPGPLLKPLRRDEDSTLSRRESSNRKQAEWSRPR